MRRLADTNILVDETLEDSERHELACRLIDSSDEVLLPKVVLLEYIWVMLKKVGTPYEFLSRKIEEYYMKFVPYCERLADIELAFSMMEEDDAPFSQFNDYLILACARNNRLQLLTFDSGLKNRAEKRGISCLP